MRLFLDSNVVVDYLARRQPFFEPARKLMTLACLGEFEVCVSTSQVADIVYVLTQGKDEVVSGEVRNSLRALCSFVSFCPLEASGLDQALDSSWSNFEAACVYQVARSAKADVILTRNKKVFEQSKIKVFDCDEFFAWLEKKKGICYEELSLQPES